MLEGLHQLGFAYHHQNPIRHHRKLTGGRDYLLGGYVCALADSFIEILGEFVDTIVDNGLADLVRVIGLLAHQEIDGFELTGLYYGDQLLTLRSDINSLFSHFIQI